MNQSLNYNPKKNNVLGRLLLRGVVLASLAIINAPAQSGADAVAGQNSTQEALVKRINELEAAQRQMQEKIDRLTGTMPTAAVASAATPAPVAPTASTSSTSSATPQSEPAETAVPEAVEPGHTLGPIQFQGFSDVDYGKPWFENLPPGGFPGSPKSFTIGDMDLFVNSRIGEHWSVLAELLITSDFSNEFSAEIDRLLLTYKHNNYFKISFGKYNTALGYYTNEFHRAQYFQTGIGRPIMYSDEDNQGILPVHNIGVTATGEIPSESLGLHWVAEVANGVSANPTQALVQNYADLNNGKAFNLALYARPEFLHGLQAGFSFYRDKLYPANVDAVHQNIMTAHIVYLGSRLEWLNEAALLRHAVEGTNQVYRATTGYSQLAWAFGKTRPYFRYDYQNVPFADPIFGVLGRRNGPSVGISRHLSNYVALKLQYDRLSERALATSNGFTTQLAFAF